MSQYSGIVNDFLVTDINKNSDFCKDILMAMTHYPMKNTCFYGNIYELKIMAEQAVLTNMYDEIKIETIDLAKLNFILQRWYEKITGIKFTPLLNADVHR